MNVVAEPEAEPARTGSRARAIRPETIRLTAYISVGVLLGTAATVGHLPGLVVATIFGLWCVVVGAADLADNSVAFGRVACLLAGIDLVLVHHSPDITLMELVLLLPAAAVLVSRAGALVGLARREVVFRTFAICALGLLLLGLLYAFWQPTKLGLGVSRKELGKNAEIVFGILAVVAWIDSRERFVDVYAIFAMIALFGAIEPAYTYRGNVFSIDSLQTEAPLIFVLLALPFVRRPPVAILIGVAAVVMVVARTRGTWILVVLFALGIVAFGPLRRRVGRRIVLGVAAAALLMLVAVLVVSPARARLSLLVSGHDQSIKTRLGMIHAAGLELGKHPLTGVGPGHFKTWQVANGAPVYYRIGLVKIPSDPHDAFAKFAGELGVPGLILFAGMIFAVFAAPWVVLRRRRLPPPTDDDPIDLRPYVVGMLLYAPVFVVLRFLSEWASTERVELIGGSALFLSLLRLTRNAEAEPGG